MKTELPPFTPGPWKLIPADGITFKWPAIQRGEEGGFVVKGRSDLQAKADAHLIAAAPDLLKEARRWLEFAKANWKPGDLHDEHGVCWIHDLEKAVAKAEGRAS